MVFRNKVAPEVAPEDIKINSAFFPAEADTDPDACRLVPAAEIMVTISPSAATYQKRIETLAGTYHRQGTDYPVSVRRAAKVGAEITPLLGS